MEFPPTTRRQLHEWLDLATDPDIFAAHEEDVMTADAPYPDQYTEPDIDRIIAEVDHELAAEARIETRRVNRDFLDERRARRAARRAERAVVRSLPMRLDVAEAVETREAAA